MLPFKFKKIIKIYVDEENSILSNGWIIINKYLGSDKKNK